MVKRSVMVSFVKEYRAVIATMTSFIGLFIMFMTFSSGKVDRSEFDIYKDLHEKTAEERHIELKKDLEDIKGDVEDIDGKLDQLILNR